jgi:hypothetical protein
MFFPFTFTMSVPGIMNPFAKSPYPLSDATESRSISSSLQDKRLLSPADRRPHPSSLSPPVPLARKRGWQPSSPEPSPAATVMASTTGHLDVHPAYRDSTISPGTRGVDQGSEMAPGRYICIADCTFLLWLEAACIIHARLFFTADNTIRMHVAVHHDFCSWLP